MAVSLPQTKSARLDPLLLFPVEVVAIIVDHLQPSDTEILRRVCKKWKRLSETCNDRRTIARHCPAISEDLKRDLGTDTPDSAIANLYFRRWLYHEQSIKAGLARRAVRFYKVTHWDIRGDRMIVGGREGALEIYSLALGSMGKLMNQLVLKDLLKPFNPGRFWLAGLYAIKGGGFIVQLDAANPYLAKLTEAGEVVWFTRNWWNGVAVGETTLYVFHYMPMRPNIAELETLDLINGAQQSISSVVPPAGLSKAFGRFQLTLSTSEAFVAVKSKNKLMCIFDTSSGVSMTIYVHGQDTYIRSNSSPIRAESNGTDFLEALWLEHNVKFVFRYVYDKNSHSFQRMTILDLSEWFTRYSRTPCGGIDIYRRLIFSERRLGKVSTFVIEPLESLIASQYESTDSTNPLTVPSGQEGRECVKFAIEDTMEDDWVDPDTFEIHGGYMVFHHVTTRRLMIASFWPPW